MEGVFFLHDGPMPDTARRQQRRLAHAPGQCLGALEMLNYKLTISSQGALSQDENALVPLPFQKLSTVNHILKEAPRAIKAVTITR